MPDALSPDEILAFLTDAPMFGDLGEEELSQIAGIMTVERLDAGQVVFAEGDPGDAWYVVYDGEVEVAKGSEGAGERIIAILGRRACFGEMAILDGWPRSATVRATSPCTLLRFPRRAFTPLLEQDSLAAYKLVHQMSLVLVSRQRRTTTRLARLMGEGDSVMRDGLAPIVEQSAVAE